MFRKTWQRLVAGLRDSRLFNYALNMDFLRARKRKEIAAK